MSENNVNEKLNQEEVVEETMTSMEDALESVQEVKVGDMVTVDVLAFDDNQVRVAIQESGGVEGVIPRNELSTTPFEELTDVVNIGDEIEAVVVKPVQDKENGNFVLSKKRVDAKKVWNEIQEKAENNETITAPVTRVVKGGLVVDAGVRGFIPASMVEDYYVDDFSPYVDQELELKIVEVEPNENRLILSHKEVSRQKREEAKQNRMDELKDQVGEVIQGKVARLVNFGAFIDLDGVDGLVHISRIAHEHVNKPSDFLTPGETVDVKVLSVDEEAGRVSLSIKDTLPGPWDNIEERAPEGAVLDGVVKRIVDFGVFVEVFPGVEGLVHISEVAHEHIATPHEKLQEGQEVKVKVLGSDSNEERLSLSIKALEEAPEGLGEQKQERPKKASKPRAKKARKPKADKAASSSQTLDGATDATFSLGDAMGGSSLDELLEGLDLD